MRRSTIILIAFCFLFQSAKAQDPSIIGNIWIDFDFDWTYDNEEGIEGVKIYLRKTETDEIIDSTFSVGLEFNFPSNNGIIIPADDYYLEIPKSQWESGGPLTSFLSCPFDNEADDGIDNDDNGLGTDHKPIKTSSFQLDSTLVEYVDFCFVIGCDQPNQLAVPSCDQIEEVDILCDISILSSFCNTLPSTISSGNQPYPLCPDGGIANNISWFSFVAYDGNYELVLSSSYCNGSTTGNEGLQMGIYTDCTFTEPVFCSSECNLSPIVVESSLFIPGATYYMFIDGCGNSFCSYEIDMNGSPIPPDLGIDNICVMDNGTPKCEDVESCTNKNVIFQAENDNPDVTYNWQITAIAGGPFTADASPTTIDNNLELSFNAEGIYEVCVISIENVCGAMAWNGSQCITITIDDDFCDPCDQDTIPPVVHAVDLSSAVVTSTGEVKIYAIDFILLATDECTPKDSLVYSFNGLGPDYDEFYDASIRSSFKYLDCCNVVNSPEEIEIYVFDLNGNVGADTITTTILPPSGGGCEGCENDTISPILETIPNIIWVFDKDSSQLEIWASDFVSTASDNCTGSSNLKYSFEPTSPFDDPSSSFQIFYCEDVENSPFTLPIYAWDKSGNYVLDSAEIIIQPEMGLDCDEFAEDITGNVLNLKNLPIMGAKVYIITSDGQIIDSTTTDESGFYSLFAIPAQKFVRIEYKTNDIPLITALDLIAIQKYMLGLVQFSTPEILAADINNDGKVRVNDLRILRKIIFGIIDQNEYLDNSWKFSTMDSEISPSEINRFPIEQAQMPKLIGYRIGDLK